MNSCGDGSPTEIARAAKKLAAQFNLVAKKLLLTLAEGKFAVPQKVSRSQAQHLAAQLHEMGMKCTVVAVRTPAAQTPMRPQQHTQARLEVFPAGTQSHPRSHDDDDDDDAINEFGPPSLGRGTSSQDTNATRVAKPGATGIGMSQVASRTAVRPEQTRTRTQAQAQAHAQHTHHRGSTPPGSQRKRKTTTMH